MSSLIDFMSTASLLGWVATFLFTICYVPQIVKTLRSKSVEGLSFLLLFIQFIANIIALWYASLIDQPPLQVKYVLGILFLVLCIGAYVRVLYYTTKPAVASYKTTHASASDNCSCRRGHWTRS